LAVPFERGGIGEIAPFVKAFAAEPQDMKGNFDSLYWQ
jgi:hypothetical protein